MSAKTKLTWIGLAMILSMPFLPYEAAVGVRVVAGLVLLGALFVTIFARTPVRRLVVGMRVLLAALAVALLLCGSNGHLRNGTGWDMLLLALIFGAISIEPSLPSHWRRPLYMGVSLVVGVAIVMLVGTRILGHRLNISFMMGPLVVVFNRKGSRCALRGLEEWVERKHEQAARWMEHLEPSALSKPPVRSWVGRRRLYAALSKLSGSKLSVDERYMRLVEICLRYPRVELAMQVAYATAVARSDWETASLVTQRAAMNGFVIGALRPDVLPQLAQRLGPRWREIVVEDDLRSLLAGTNDGRPPAIEQWRRDPEFAELEAAFAPSRVA